MRIVFGLERTFTTLLKVEEDARDPDCLITTFDLVRSVSGRHRGSRGWQRSLQRARLEQGAAHATSPTPLPPRRH